MDKSGKSPKENAKKAVALRYDPKTDSSPEVIAKGDRLMAGKIIALATQHGIPLHQDPALVEKLIRLDLNTHIPPELYTAVGALLAFIYRLDGRLGAKAD